MRARGGFWPSGASRFGARTRRCAFSTTRPLDPQVDDPRVLFEAVYAQVLSDRKTQPPSPGSVGLLMPKELIWLVGAPGSGKGTHSRSIMEQRGITADPVVMSDLLLSGGPPSAGAESGDRAADVVRDAVRAAMNDGRLVPDSHVFTLLLHELAHERYEAGAVIDGFPRNVMQANLVLELHNKMKELRERFGRPFRRPKFRVAVLWVPEDVSVERQLKRGIEARAENEQRRRYGLPPRMSDERATDFDADKARERYHTFLSNYDTIKALQRTFHFSVIDATRPKEQVRDALLREFTYQSSLELSPETYSQLHELPTLSQVTMHARQRLVQRLDSYDRVVMTQAVSLVASKLMPPIHRAAISGRAAVRVPVAALGGGDDKLLVDVICDILADRGFYCQIEKVVEYRPSKVDLQTGQIDCDKEVWWRFIIEFPKSVLLNRAHRVIGSSANNTKATD